jgi:hypothetical protein
LLGIRAGISSQAAATAAARQASAARQQQQQQQGRGIFGSIIVPNQKSLPSSLERKFAFFLRNVIIDARKRWRREPRKSVSKLD